MAPSSEDDLGGKQRALDFEQWFYSRSPFVKTLPTLQYELLLQFNSSEAINEYVTAEDYGTTGPKVVMGIVWEGNSASDYRYALRQNATNFNAPEAASRPATLTTPDAARKFADYARNDAEVCLPIDDTPSQGYLEATLWMILVSKSPHFPRDHMKRRTSTPLLKVCGSIPCRAQLPVLRCTKITTG